MKKKNIRYVIKYMLLFVLIIGAGVQTAKLWLDIPSYSKLLENISTGENTIESEQNNVDIVVPSAVGIKIEEDDAYYMVNDKLKGYEVFLDSCNHMIVSGINKKYIAKIPSEDFDFGASYIIIDYPFKVDKELFFTMYRADEYDDFPEYIDYILIKSDIDDVEGNRVFIHSVEDDMLYEHSVNYNDVYLYVEALNDTKKYAIYDQNISYELSENSEYNFKKTFLLPNNMEYAMLNYSVEPYIPFVDDEKILEKELTAFVGDFLQNKEALSPSIINENMVYIGDNAVVKYSKNGVFEYIQGIDKRDVKENFLLDFSKGIDFIDKKIDKGLVEYYLNSYEYKDDGLHIYYDLGYNGIVFDMTDISADNNIAYPMEVLVYNGKVVYFKWLLRFMPEIIKQPERIMLSYDYAMKDVKDGICDDLKLVYRTVEDGSPMLNWLIVDGDKKYYREVESE